MPSVSSAQARFMAACAHGAGYASCPPKKVSEEFNMSDKGTGIIKPKSHRETPNHSTDQILNAYIRKTYGGHRGA